MIKIYKLGICLILLCTQASALATNRIHDKQLLQAYDILIKQPGKKGTAVLKNQASVNKTVVKAKNGRTPQFNATLIAKKQINKKYRWGGANPKTGFDCSGLMQYAYKFSKVYLPRTAAAQYQQLNAFR